MWYLKIESPLERRDSLCDFEETRPRRVYGISESPEGDPSKIKTMMYTLIPRGMNAIPRVGNEKESPPEGRDSLCDFEETRPRRVYGNPLQIKKNELMEAHHSYQKPRAGRRPAD